MFNANMPSLSDIAAVTGNDRDGGWGGNGWWIIIILLAMWGDLTALVGELTV